MMLFFPPVPNMNKLQHRVSVTVVRLYQHSALSSPSALLNPSFLVRQPLLFQRLRCMRVVVTHSLGAFLYRYWESVQKPKRDTAVNGHFGVYAYHCDDCMCSMGDWPCKRDGEIWSCCGQTTRYSHCTKMEQTSAGTSEKQ